MLSYIFRRLGVLFVIISGSSYILYNLAAYSGNPLDELVGSRDPNIEGIRQNLIEQLRLDVPPPLRYFIWLRGVLGVFSLNLDLGESRTGENVMVLIGDAIPVTIRLILGSTIFAIVVGITLGILSALRQYSRFDYSMTFMAFLLFSLPVFWVAVLLKEFLAIQFNDFLSDPSIGLSFMIGFSAIAALFWASILGRKRKVFWATFAGFFALHFVTIYFINATDWLLDPGIGPIFFALTSLGIAIGITQISMGISHRPALTSSLVVAAIGAVSYFPMQSFFDRQGQVSVILGAFVLTMLIAVGVSLVFARVDRGPVIRTSVITGFIIGLVMIVDRLMQTWSPYISSGDVQYRPIPTIGEKNPLLTSDDFWINFLDTLLHMFLPTIALTLIGFAGYIRYSRGTLLEVLNQDYIRTARAKGLNERTVIMRHAFRNTMIPIVTLLVVDFAGVLGGALITENVFAWRGMGTLFRTAIYSFDLNLLMGVFLVTATLALLANLIADLLYSALDPRIRVGSGRQ